MQSEENILKVIQESFRLEMGERLLTLSQQLALLEDNACLEGSEPVAVCQGALTAILRELHNLKGAARAVNLPEIEELCHAAESLMRSYQQSCLEDSSFQCNLDKTLDLMYDSIGWGDKLLNQLNLHQSLALPGLSDFITHLLDGLSEPPAVHSLSTVQKAQAATSEEPGIAQALSERAARGSYQRSTFFNHSTTQADNSFRISGTKLDDLLAASTELLVARLRIRQHRDEIADLMNEGQAWGRLWRGVRGSHARLSQYSLEENGKRNKDLRNLLHFVEVNQQKLKHFEGELINLHARFNRDVSYLSTVTDQLQFEARRLRLLPLSTAMEELERAVRQLARDLGKQVQLEVHGAELEVDKKLLDEVKTPLLHLIRNAIDHGLESPAQRLHLGKPATGKVRVSFRQTGRSIELEVQDDGAGIDLERVKELAVARGLVTPTEAVELSRNEILQFLFHSGFSTREQISDISGRGIGLDSVREAAARLGGNVEVETAPGSGTTFRFSLPNMLVTAEGIIVKTAGQTYVLPVDMVERSFSLTDIPVQTIGSRKYLLYNDKQVPLLVLSEVLGLPAAPKTPGTAAGQYAVVLQSHGKCAAFIVDSLLRNQEVVVKNFSKPLVRVRNVAGATIMSDGSVVLILNVAELIQTALKQPVGSANLTVSGRNGADGGYSHTTYFELSTQATVGEQYRILVVDDSITTRTLEKNILEAAGFYVQTARNGVEALNHLRGQHFDLVVADLEMPEMNGLQLTSHIKQDQRLLETPVIIVTSLDTAEDKARGMDAGADAYLVKSRFDQQALLNTIKQLI
ncbi:MAG TPA: hybrid sensor histidine kinase/response regulator [Chloroflexia bacterium]|nr:hybrid sensor histidine kinase/response regulator [Chloroflexia bacterium]